MFRQLLLIFIIQLFYAPFLLGQVSVNKQQKKSTNSRDSKVINLATLESKQSFTTSSQSTSNRPKVVSEKPASHNDVPTKSNFFAPVTISSPNLPTEKSDATGRTNTANIACDSWLKLDKQPAYVRVGDLDITGNQLTVEAVFSRTSMWSGSDLFQGDLVSKHEGPEDVNYLLRPSSAEITTTSGYFRTPSICAIELNKTYHAAMVYDGSVLKFYRNGYLMSQVAATGDLITNNWLTQIGLYFNGVTREQFEGFINEVRIWSIARTHDEIKTFMYRSLPNPQSLPGLQAYYRFDNLLNKQGNAKWNGTLAGNAQNLTTNPHCDFVADSCGKLPCTAVIEPDFTFLASMCDAGKYTFHTQLPAGTTAAWDIAGMLNTTSSEATVTFASEGVFPVKLKWKTAQGCADSITKKISTRTTPSALIQTSRNILCANDTVMVGAARQLVQFCWKSPDGLPLPPSAGGVIKPHSSGVLQLTAIPFLTNLLQNPQFEESALGFTTSYQPAITPGPGNFRILNDLSGTEVVSCNTATAGNGRRLVVGMSNDAGSAIWEQKLSGLLPNTNYLLHARYMVVGGTESGKVQWSANGTPVGTVFDVQRGDCVWREQVLMWNSGDQTSVALALKSAYAENSLLQLAIDDLYFGEAMLFTDMRRLTIQPQPELTLQGQPKVCLGQKTQLTATTNVPGSSIRWTGDASISAPDAFSTNVQPTQSRYLIATVRAPSGCTASDSLLIEVAGLPETNMPVALSVCEGSTVSLNASYERTALAEWTPAAGIDNPSGTHPKFNPTASTRYFVRLTSSDGCTILDSLDVKVLPVPAGKISKSNDIDCATSSALLSASGGSRYEWSPAADLMEPRSAVTVASPFATTTYTVRIYNANACFVELPVTVNVTTDGKGGNYIPNAFTPNGDGKNDCFGVKGWGAIKTFSLSVYNRWGERVFFSSQPNSCWNGWYKGILQPKGTYVYQVSAKTLCGDVNKTGSVVLLY